MKTLLYKFFTIIYSQYVPTGQSIKKLFLYAFFQKIFGINRATPWPVHFTSQVKASHKIESMDQSPGFAPNCQIDGRNGIKFGENVWIGPRVSVISQNHDLCDFKKYIPGPPVIIGKNSLLLTGSVILPGVELGEHTVVAAGAVVTKSFLQGNVVIGGTPAKVLKEIGRYKA